LKVGFVDFVFRRDRSKSGN